jgi:hypothetical protein
MWEPHLVCFVLVDKHHQMVLLRVTLALKEKRPSQEPQLALHVRQDDMH